MARRIAGSLTGMVYLAGLCLLNPVNAQTVPPVELHVSNVNPGIHVVSGAGGNVVVWSGADGTVLVDSGRGDGGPALVEAIARIAPGPVRFVFNTSGHADHAGANETFALSGAIVVGHESLRMNAGRDPAVPAGIANDPATAAGRPMLTTNEALALHLNGDRLDVIHVADAHTTGDLVLRWNDADVVALGDIYWNGQYPSMDVGSGGSMAGTVAAIEAALARANARTVIIPGHGPVSNRTELAAYRDMLVGVGSKVRKALEQGMGLEDVLATKPTAEFDARFARPGASVAPDEFVRSVYGDLAPKRPGR
jgi:cyclase